MRDETNLTDSISFWLIGTIGLSLAILMYTA